MKIFLKKLEQNAGRWLETMDSQLQQPVIQMVTGEVFTHGTTTAATRIEAEPAPQPVHDQQPPASPIPHSQPLITTDSGEYQRPLRQTGALQGS